MVFASVELLVDVVTHAGDGSRSPRLAAVQRDALQQLAKPEFVQVGEGAFNCGESKCAASPTEVTQELCGGTGCDSTAAQPARQ